MVRLKGFELCFFTYPLGQMGFAALTVFAFFPRTHLMLTTFAGDFPVRWERWRLAEPPLTVGPNGPCLKLSFS